MKVNIYRLDKNLKTVELGKGDVREINTILKEMLANADQHYQSAEEDTAAKTLAIFKTKLDFIEISCTSKDSAYIFTDRMCYASRWSGFFSSKTHFLIETDSDSIYSIIQNYIEMDRESFEMKYQEYLRKQ